MFSLHEASSKVFRVHIWRLAANSPHSKPQKSSANMCAAVGGWRLCGDFKEAKILMIDTMSDYQSIIKSCSENIIKQLRHNDINTFQMMTKVEAMNCRMKGLS